MIRIRRPRRRTIAAITTFAIAIACVPAYVSAYTVSGPSEAPTLLLGDVVIVNHAAYDLRLPYSTIKLGRIGSPARGDLVLFQVPNRESLGLKRVVGLPGDVIELRENHLYMNGKAVALDPLSRRAFDWVPETHELGTHLALERLSTESRGHQITWTPGLSPLRNMAAIEVPEDCYFLLGDHRDNSNDSRTFGAVARSLIGGKVITNRTTHPDDSQLR